MADLGGLVEELALFRERPLDFVYYAFPWGDSDSVLDGQSGPVDWQIRVLGDLQNEYARGRAAGDEAMICALREAYKIAIRSGHGVGKTALLAWLCWWAISTFAGTRGRVTANTEKQLSSILWPELMKWHRLFIGRDLFKTTATRIASLDPEWGDNWRIDAVTWSEDNTQAFAGLHNRHRRVLVVMDEASDINDGVWTVTDGVMHEADTELLWIAPGNPTRNFGRFYECWHRFTEEWHTYKVDSREVPFSNQAVIERAIRMWGEDSDYVKVRYLGDFPDAATNQLFPLETIRYARLCPAQSQPWEPLIMAVDVARFGKNESVIKFRRGKDARSLPAMRFRGLSTMELGDKIAALASTHTPDAIFIDEGGVGGGVVDYVRRLGHSVMGVQFGGKPGEHPQGERVANKRAEMYVRLLQDMRGGLAIEDDDEIQEQLTAVEYYHTKTREEIILVSKEDMPDSVQLDVADAYAITYAFPVSPSLRSAANRHAKTEYDPFSNDNFREVA